MTLVVTVMLGILAGISFVNAVVDQGFASDGIRVVARGIPIPGISVLPSPMPVPGAFLAFTSPSTSPASARIWFIASVEMVLSSLAAPWMAINAPDPMLDHPQPDPPDPLGPAVRPSRFGGRGFLLPSPGAVVGGKAEAEAVEERGRGLSPTNTERSGAELDVDGEGDGIRDRAA